MRRPQVRRFSTEGWSATDGELAAFGSTAEEALERFAVLAKRDDESAERADPQGRSCDEKQRLQEDVIEDSSEETPDIRKRRSGRA